jgi:hypothetical protein
VESGSWQASAAVHSLWPDNGSPPDKRVKMKRARPQRGMKLTAAPQQTIMGFLGKRSIWDQSAPVMHNQVGRAPRSEPEDVQQDRETTGDAPVDQIMDTAGRTWAEEDTAAPEVINLDTWSYNSIEQLQAWFTQETEKELQLATSDRNRDLRRSSLLWHPYQRKAAEARTVRPWKGRLFALGQPLGEPLARDTSAGTHGECTHQEQWTIQSKEGVQISCQDECVRRQHSVNTNATVRVSETGWAGTERQQRQQDIVMLDSAHKDTGRWQLLGIRERVRVIQEWITWETRQDISDA